ncbi:MAG: CatB-related O-acetyltransferase [Leptolyngbyaceae cyanobacterium bins.302]|nr:CatB-related O-acetyltransferase [Leptolyngbyaceae cyanobacterium bins.302]
MTSFGPDPNRPYPMADQRRVCFIKPFIKSPNIIVGDYTYYDDPIDPEGFERNVLYNFGDDRLVIGKFCAIATRVQFIMGGANHKLDGISTYPFPIFGNGWEGELDTIMNLPSKGDTVVGHDVWLGYDALILPGVSIGDGAVIGARSVVAGDIPPYAIAAGNPARVIKQRFSDADITRLLEIQWWNWDLEKITRNLSVIMHGDVDALMQVHHLT